MTYRSINPFSGELLKRFDQHSDLQMERALARANIAFQKRWSTATFRDRARIVGQAASLMSERKESLARLAAAGGHLLSSPKHAICRTPVLDQALIAANDSGCVAHTELGPKGG